MLLSYSKAKVVTIEEEYERVSWIKVKMNNSISRAINYTDITGPVKEGDMVIVNTTAVELSLGTGGAHFVLYNYSNESKKLEGKGHIMKLRYTPIQFKVLAAEEEGSGYHHIFNEFRSLNNYPVIVGSLHSMLGPIAAMLKWFDNKIKINYLMTDGGALPLAFSNTVRDLKAKKLIDSTITIGHAFGGDLECTNIYTGLIAAKEILKSDVTIVAMGPGIVGTGTKYGFSGIEQGHIIDAVNTLGGQAIIVPRISFKDARERHFGISHHTRTVLTEIVKTGGKLILPLLEDNKLNILKLQIDKLDIENKYEIIYEYGDDIVNALSFFQLEVSTMGRDYNNDKEYFKTLGAVGKFVYKGLK
ncbi:DUF3866 family protein [Tepidimicrobium xylanilyticum]|uniref:DUF3866 domain-containing protein n=1 Tax=Tepidimicrobium xylanilyticum TaxID=1123352 RepID=A0A1H3CTG9_9FIRM|nr:DUF3866 family protein [Tepidimicrobium xylanilyticum]GMG97733.1 hypothetical protein EN5CB1_25590 [Tepidimicrobium xylanilyticum]SDX57437.1 Protein of unknown function [Tepidimicrobium xylanilyticum]